MSKVTSKSGVYGGGRHGNASVEQRMELPALRLGGNSREIRHGFLTLPRAIQASNRSRFRKTRFTEVNFGGLYLSLFLRSALLQLSSFFDTPSSTLRPRLFFLDPSFSTFSPRPIFFNDPLNNHTSDFTVCPVPSLRSRKH
jgi:hypothetical protein